MYYYKFIESIAMTWLDEGKYDPKKQRSRRSQSVPIDSSISLSIRTACRKFITRLLNLIHQEEQWYHNLTQDQAQAHAQA